VSRRLLISYLTLTVFVLAALEIPLGISYARNERQNLSTRVERDAVSLASLAEDTLEGGRSADPAALASLAGNYQRDTGGRVVIVDAEGMSVVDSSDPGGPRSFASRPEIETALREGTVATGVRHSTTLGIDLLYVTVPIASSGVIHGAVRITYPMSAVEDRVLRYWLILAAIAAVVLVAVGLIGRRIARSIARPLADVERAAAAAAPTAT
jgi:sensor histidine kinase regulating citrate/malate metabolism